METLCSIALVAGEVNRKKSLTILYPNDIPFLYTGGSTPYKNTNPCTITTLLRKINDNNKSKWISFSGGDPLHYQKHLKTILYGIQKPYKIQLRTCNIFPLHYEVAHRIHRMLIMIKPFKYYTKSLISAGNILKCLEGNKEIKVMLIPESQDEVEECLKTIVNTMEGTYLTVFVNTSKLEKKQRNRETNRIISFLKKFGLIPENALK